MKEIWQEYKLWIIGVPLAAILLFVGGGVYRVSTGGEFIPKENPTDRAKRLSLCREYYKTTPTVSQQLDGDGAGVCSGFTTEEIEATINK